MSSITLVIKTDNAAFRCEDGTLDRAAVEVALHDAARRVTNGRIGDGETVEHRLYDRNGNLVGSVTVDEDDRVCEECGYPLIHDPGVLIEYGPVCGDCGGPAESMV